MLLRLSSTGGIGHGKPEPKCLVRLPGATNNGRIMAAQKHTATRSSGSSPSRPSSGALSACSSAWLSPRR